MATVQFKACLSFLPSFELNSISRMSNYIHEECLLEFGSDLLCKFHSLKEEREKGSEKHSGGPYLIGFSRSFAQII